MPKSDTGHVQNNNLQRSLISSSWESGLRVFSGGRRVATTLFIFCEGARAAVWYCLPAQAVCVTTQGPHPLLLVGGFLRQNKNKARSAGATDVVVERFGDGPLVDGDAAYKHFIVLKSRPCQQS